MANTGTPLPVGQTPQGDLFIQAQALQSNKSRYDSYKLVAGSVIPRPIPFFVVPLDTIGSGFTYPKTRAETNMLAARQLERPIAGTVNQIIMSFYPVGNAPTSDATTLYLSHLMEDSILSIYVDDILQKTEHPLVYGGTGLTGVPQMNNAQPDQFISASPLLSMVKKFNPVIPIPSRRLIRVELAYNANNATLAAAVPTGGDFVITVYLNGNFTRVIG